MKSDRPVGQRFTHVYIDRGKPKDDSPRMRRRLSSVLAELGPDISEAAERKLGIATPWNTVGGWRDHLPRWELGDVLDLITIAYQVLNQKYLKDRYRPIRNPAGEFLEEVQQIFDDENLHYEVDVRGGVHYRFDEEFARSKAATIDALQGERYSNARDGFERAMAELSKATPDGKHAIRAVFAAAEGLFRLMNDGSPRLTVREADKLRPLIQRVTDGDPAAAGSSAKMLESFKGWVDAAHFYRHEPGTPEVAQPPLSLAVYLVSTGAANLRWLAEMDALSVPGR